MSPPSWKYMTSEERVLEVAWFVWVMLVWLAVPILWLLTVLL